MGFGVASPLVQLFGAFQGGRVEHFLGFFFGVKNNCMRTPLPRGLESLGNLGVMKSKLNYLAKLIGKGLRQVWGPNSLGCTWSGAPMGAE